jgi:hypothetical protein
VNGFAIVKIAWLAMPWWHFLAVSAVYMFGALFVSFSAAVSARKT